MISEIEIFLTQQGKLKNFIAKGSVKGLKAELMNNLNFEKVNFSFFADRSDILIKNIVGDLGGIEISEGDIKINLQDGLKLNSNFNSKFNFNKKFYKKHSSLFDKFEIAKNITSLKTNLNNNLFIDFDNTYKVKDYSYSISGKLEKGKYELLNPIKNSFITEEIKVIYLSDMEIKTV